MNCSEVGFCSSSRTGDRFRFRIRHIEVRILPPQPRIPAVCQASQETREWAGNPGFSRIRFGLWTPALPNLRRNRRKSPAVSANIPVLGRLSAETGSIRTAARGRKVASLVNGKSSPTPGSIVSPQRGNFQSQLSFGHVTSAGPWPNYRRSEAHGVAPNDRATIRIAINTNQSGPGLEISRPNGALASRPPRALAGQNCHLQQGMGTTMPVASSPPKPVVLTNPT